jgi:hypothetical protein
MTELEKGQKADQAPKKYLWLGYGNYGGSSVQLGGGYVRNPSSFEEFFKTPKIAVSPMTCIMCTVAGLLGFMALVMLVAWGITVLMR